MGAGRVLRKPVPCPRRRWNERPKVETADAVNDTMTSKGPTRTLLTPTASSVLVPETDLADRSAIARRLGSVLSVLFVVSSFLSFALLSVSD